MLLILLLTQILALQLYIFHGDGAIFAVAIHTLHAVVANLVRVQIATVALSAADADPLIQHAFLLPFHDGRLLRTIIAQRKKTCKFCEQLFDFSFFVCYNDH